ncbi:hypothetical protein HJFPF1_12643 [Paramyrothecium foliicola]|nr:hypothetical protein HJFPF1_12643 [Paramyrothecium foliicola]
MGETKSHKSDPDYDTPTKNGPMAVDPGPAPAVQQDWPPKTHIQADLGQTSEPAGPILSPAPTSPHLSPGLVDESGRGSVSQVSVLSQRSRRFNIIVWKPRCLHRWPALTSMVLVSIAGLSLSLALCKFHSRLNGQTVGSSSQQENKLRIGTTLAFQTQMSLTASFATPAFLGSFDLDMLFDFRSIYELYMNDDDKEMTEQRLQDKILARDQTLAVPIEQLSYNITADMLHNNLLTHTLEPSRAPRDITNHSMRLGKYDKTFQDIANAAGDPHIVSIIKDTTGQSSRASEMSIVKEGTVASLPFATGVKIAAQPSVQVSLSRVEADPGAGCPFHGQKSRPVARQMYKGQADKSIVGMATASTLWDEMTMFNMFISDLEPLLRKCLSEVEHVKSLLEFITEIRTLQHKYSQTLQHFQDLASVPFAKVNWAAVVNLKAATDRLRRMWHQLFTKLSSMPNTATAESVSNISANPTCEPITNRQVKVIQAQLDPENLIRQGSFEESSVSDDVIDLTCDSFESTNTNRQTITMASSKNQASNDVANFTPSKRTRSDRPEHDLKRPRTEKFFDFTDIYRNGQIQELGRIVPWPRSDSNKMAWYILRCEECEESFGGKDPLSDGSHHLKERHGGWVTKEMPHFQLVVSSYGTPIKGCDEKLAGLYNDALDSRPKALPIYRGRQQGRNRACARTEPVVYQSIEAGDDGDDRPDEDAILTMNKQEHDPAGLYAEAGIFDMEN